MKLFKLFFVTCSFFLIFSCSNDFLAEFNKDEDEGVIPYNGEYTKASYSSLNGTYWEIVKDEWKGNSIAYPRSINWGEKDPDNDGTEESMKRHTYYYFNNNSVIVYDRDVINDEGSIQGEFVKTIWNSNGDPILEDIYPVITDFKLEIKGGIGYISGSEGEDFLYYNYNEIYLMYENSGKTTLKRVNEEDIRVKPIVSP
jgi:hypothetical protein